MNLKDKFFIISQIYFGFLLFVFAPKEILVIGFVFWFLFYVALGIIK